ncbi:MAG: hypothetical protein HQK59_03520 [Deltaproteobacteria bacterium]|nr:hypothetical protein [Deltaproteobacteria bacterium]MBF0526181.1 hypothetical protein [Deltaproteobacteria bacterium]
MEPYQKKFARLLAESGALFFDRGLVLKDGRPSPYFVNMGMFRTGHLAWEIGGMLADMLVSTGMINQVDVLFGPSYKGSCLVAATAMALWHNHGINRLFEYDRKEAKTHGEGSTKASLMVNGSFYDGCRVLLVDDVATSMGTKYEMVDKIEHEAQRLGIEVHLAGLLIGLDRQQTEAVYDDQGRIMVGRRGENASEKFTQKTGLTVAALAGIKEVVNYIFESGIEVLVAGQRRPINQELLTEFNTYLDTYGV